MPESKHSAEESEALLRYLDLMHNEDREATIERLESALEHANKAKKTSRTEGPGAERSKPTAAK